MLIQQDISAVRVLRKNMWTQCEPLCIFRGSISSCLELRLDMLSETSKLSFFAGTLGQMYAVCLLSLHR